MSVRGQQLMNGNQSSYDDLIQIAVNGLREVQKKNPEELKQWLAKHPLFPSSISVGQDGSVFITYEGYSALKRLGRTWHANDLARSKLLSRAAAEELTVYAFGDLLGSPPKLPDDANAKPELLKCMDRRLQARTRREHFYFPARVFDQPEVQTFNIGPVTFYRRLDWLDEVERVAGSPCCWKNEVLERWTRQPCWWKRTFSALIDWFVREIVRARPSSWLAHKLLGRRANRIFVDDLVKAVGACEWIIAVTVDGRERSRSSECATIAALVALDSLGLSMPLRTARNLRGPGHERGTQLQHDLHQIGGQELGFSISLDLPRLGGPPGSQAGFMSNSTTLRDAVGHALAAFVTVGNVGNSPMLMQRWVEAMYWFGQARRETNEFIVLVKLGIALDVLAKGGRAGGILALTRAVFDKADNDVIASDNRTLKQVVETLYNDGRSKIAHGGTLALLQELPIELTLADNLTARVLAAYVVYAKLHKGNDTYESFLATLPAIRALPAEAFNAHVGSSS